MKNFKEQLKGKRILFCNVAADGHFNPMTGLAKYLQQLGCDVRWFAAPMYAKKLEKLGIHHYAYVNTLDVNQDNLEVLFPERKVITDPGAKLDFDMIHMFADRGPERFEDIKLIYETFPFDVFIADSMVTAIPFVKSLMNIPVVSIGIIPLPEASADVAPYGLALFPPVNDEERARYTELRGLMKNVVLKASTDRFDELLNNYQVPHNRELLFDVLIQESSLYLQIGTPSFEYKRSDIGKNVRFIGALYPYTEEKKTTAWYDERLKKYKKVILLTQGTVEKDVDKLIVPALEAFKDTDVLVVTATANNQTAGLRARFPQENIIIEDYIPFDEIMPYAGVFVTNGGYGGTLLSIKNKLPIVAAGIHEGKNEVCARIGYFNLGVNLGTDRPTSAQVKEAVEKVLGDGSYRENVIKLSEELGKYEALEECAGYVAEQLANSK